MPTQEERITVLEQTTREYRPVLSNFAYELTMVKGLIVEQTAITQELSIDMRDVKIQLAQVDRRLETLERDISEVKTLLTQILERLPNSR